MASEKPLKYDRKRRIAETPVDDDAVRSPQPRKDATRHGEDESATKPGPVSEINFDEKLKSITKKMEAMEAKGDTLGEGKKEEDSHKSTATTEVEREAKHPKPKPKPESVLRGHPQIDRDEQIALEGKKREPEDSLDSSSGDSTGSLGGALKGLNGQDGVIPHKFLGGKTPSNISWAADFRTAAAYAIRPNSYMAIMDTSLVENHVSVYHVPDLYHAGLSGAWFPHEYLVYGPITGPAYHCVEWSDIGPLLAGTKPRYQDALSGNQYSQEQVDLAKQLAMQFRR
ncbi:hypothetical protein AB5N19_11816 [Seiridium cardinale]|uniref:Uncharacterized protein n=1 Tax=Seiridium cardinale TaxID=138064 RepID=A0ABR2XHE7_9PEZI